MTIPQITFPTPEFSRLARSCDQEVASFFQTIRAIAPKNFRTRLPFYNACRIERTENRITLILVDALDVTGAVAVRFGKEHRHSITPDDRVIGLSICGAKFIG